MFRIAEDITELHNWRKKAFTAKTSQKVSDPIVSHNVVTGPLAAGGMIAELVDGLHAKRQHHHLQRVQL
jgi:hypothetical protein